MEALGTAIQSTLFEGAHSKGLHVFSQVIGWGYFLAWSLSFYPQVWLNYKRKSVVGYSFDYCVLNITGFFAYTVFNITLKTSTYVQGLYVQKYGGDIPVEINDIVFACHALLLSLITAAQILYYPKGNQKVSLPTIIITTILWSAMALATWLAVGGKITWLSAIYIFSYAKLATTLIKYIPQAWSNFMRKSTTGWSIGGILLDLTGGILSFGQQFVDAINAGDWAVIYGNPVKFALAWVSIGFDLIFIFQHYCCYRKKASDEEAKETLPLISENGNGAFNSLHELPIDNTTTNR